MTYLYDFGDNWQFALALESIEPAEPKLTGPRAISRLEGISHFQRFKLGPLQYELAARMRNLQVSLRKSKATCQPYSTVHQRGLTRINISHGNLKFSNNLGEFVTW